MDCRKFQKNLEDYLEGGLDFAGRFGMERHAQQCYPCGRTESDAQKLKRLAHEIKRVSAPPNFEAAVLARIHDRKSRVLWGGLRSRLVFGLEWPSVALAASGLSLFLVAILFSLHHFAGTDRPAKIAVEQAPARNLPSSTPPLQEELLPATDPDHSSSNRVTQLPVNSSNLTSAGTPARRPRKLYSTDEFTIDLSNPGDSDYVEYWVTGPDNRPMIMRLPNIIRMQYGQASEEHFIRNVSH